MIKPEFKEWERRVYAALLFEKYRQEEIRRLDEKARLMESEGFDDRARVSDKIWRDQNERLRIRAGALLLPVPPKARA